MQEFHSPLPQQMKEPPGLLAPRHLWIHLTPTQQKQLRQVLRTISQQWLSLPTATTTAGDESDEPSI